MPGGAADPGPPAEGAPEQEVPAGLLRDLLAHGELVPKGRIMPASNVTFFAEVGERDLRLRCVYKPVAGERPLWDFPDGTLAAREVAAYVVSQALGWDVVPATLLREGPAGPGMVQVWCEPDPDQDPVDIVPSGAVARGWLHVLDATDGEDRDVSLVHEDSAPLRRMAVFDVLVNNADRKGGHVLPMPGGHRYGVDHGLCFHAEDKLRTVLWGWAERRLDPGDAADLAALAACLDSPDDPLPAALGDLLSGRELAALRRRVAGLLASGRMPSPSGRWPAIPWPAF